MKQDVRTLEVEVEQTDKGGAEMSQVHKLTARALREQTKRGWTLVDFCTRYHCDGTALKAQIRRIICDNDRSRNSRL